MHYRLLKYKKKGYYDILKDISEHVTLFQFVYYLGNVNCAISVVGYWIFYSYYKKSLVLNRESLNMTCATSVGEEQVTEFETVFTAVRYICFGVKLKKDSDSVLDSYEEQEF